MATSKTKPTPSFLTRGTIPTSLIELVLEGLPSDHTRRAYRKAYVDLQAFSAGQEITLVLLLKWRTAMATTLSSSTVNVRISAVRKLIEEARRKKLITADETLDLLDLRGLPNRGTRIGNWLTLSQRDQLLAVPGRKSNRGIRNYCILAILAGCALRVDELAGVDVDVIQKRDGRWVFKDLIGKGGRVRTVAIPPRTKAAIDAWLKASEIKEGRLIRQLTLSPKGLSTQAIWDIVHRAAASIGIEKFGPHDLRRTCARLCWEAKRDLVAIQDLLGHADPNTTRRYLGNVQDLRNAVNDNIGM